MPWSGGRGRDGKGQQSGGNRPNKWNAQDNSHGGNLTSESPQVSPLVNQLSKLSTKDWKESKTKERIAKAEERAKQNAEREAKQKKWQLAESDMTKFAPGPPDVQVNQSLIRANFFRFDIRAGTQYHKYRIELDKINGAQPSNRDARRDLIRGLLAQNAPDARFWACDYFDQIVSVGKLYDDHDQDEEKRFERQHKRTANNGKTAIMNSFVIFDGLVQIDRLRRLVSQQDVPIGYHPDADLKALNLLSWVRINFEGWAGARIGKKFYPDDSRLHTSLCRYHKFGGQMQKSNVGIYTAKTGFFTSVRPGHGSLLLNVNPTTSAFFIEVTVQDWLNRMLGVQPYARYEQGHPNWAGVTSALNGVMVTSKIFPNRKRKIFSTGGLSVSNQKFQVGDEPVTMVTHMTRKYGPGTDTDLVFDDNVCCVNLGSREDEQWFPADHLLIAPNQMVRKQLDRDFMPDMLDCAKLKPEINQATILGHARSHLAIVSPHPASPQPTPRGKPTLAQLGLTVGPDLITLGSRLLNKPALLYSAGARLTIPTTAATMRTWPPRTNKSPSLVAGLRASWDLTHITKKPNATFQHVPNNYRGLKIIRVQEEARNEMIINPFTKNLVQELPRYGFSNIANFVHQSDRRNAQYRAGEDATRRRRNFGGELDRAYAALGSPQLVLVILPSEQATIYSDVKWWSDCVRGIRTVCLQERKTVRKGSFVDGGNTRLDRNLHGNLALKINFKLGGTNHSLDGKDWYGAKAFTIVMGADVAHVGRGTESGVPSMAGVVATRDIRNGHYLASARLQSSNTEFIAALDDMVEERLLAFFTHNRRMPAHILFYRDGVSESQYGMVRGEELPLIKKGCIAAGKKKLDQDEEWVPLITLVVVGKRHHTRFYPGPNVPAPAQGGVNFRNENLHAGLVIDHTVISPNKFSFYLQSHDSPLGTAKSGHYIVMENGSGYTAAELQVVTHDICFTGSRANKAMSICTPAKYADILCDRLRCYMRPALDKQIVPAMSKTATPADYARKEVIWQQANMPAGRRNPWHPSLDDIMFYL